MKRSLLVLLCVLCALLLFACDGVKLVMVTPSPSPAPKRTPVPTDTPVPTPAPVVAVVAEDRNAGFWEGLQTFPADDGAFVQRVEGGLEAVPALHFEGASVILVCLTEPSPDFAPLRQAMERGSHVYVYAANGQQVPEDIPSLTYREAGSAEAALERALTYPPHDTPVRLFGLLANGESAAYRAWAAAAAEGRIFAKAVFYADGGDDFAAWMDKRLDKTYPGMLDGIYAETAALALAATEALVAAGRTDMEVFSAAVDDAVLAMMLEHPEILVSATGANPIRAGRLLRESAYAQLLGILPASKELLPRTFTAETLAAEWAALGEG